MSTADYPAEVNGHSLQRTEEPFDNIRASYECVHCGSTELAPETFNTYGCPGSDYAGTEIADRTAINNGDHR